MMKRTKQILALLLAVLMIVPTLAACTKKEEQEQQQENEISLTPDVKSVFLGTDQFRVALTIDGAEFEDSLSKEDLYLDNAFDKNEIEIISKSNKNLTLEIKGELKKNVAGAYQWGTVGVKSTGIKNGQTDVEAKINVILNYAGFDATALTYADGKITADIKVYGIADVDALKKDNVTVEGVTVESLAKVDDNAIRLILSAAGVASVNDFVDLVSGKKMTLGEYETNVVLSQANFYPVFDYIEKAGDNFDITLKLYFYGGTIDNTLTADKIGLGSDFEGASVKSVAMDKNDLATLILTVPCGGFTEDNYQFDGEVTLKAGAVTNAWGEKTSADYTYARNYSAETLGRDVTLNTDTLLEIQKYTNGTNTTFGKICYWGGVAGQVFSIGKSILEATGVIKSEHVQVMEKLDAMDQKLDNIQVGITDIKHELKSMLSTIEFLAIKEEKREIQNKIEDFETLLIDFYNTLDSVKAVQQCAALDMALEEAGVKANYTGMTAEQVAAEKARLRQEYLPDVDSMTDLEAAEYTEDLMDFIDAKSSKRRNTEYYSYYTRVEELESKFKLICGMINKSQESNPIGFYDELCSFTYNFDSQTYDFRLANRVTLQYRLVEALSALAIHYTAAATPDSEQFELIGSAFAKAMTNNVWKVSGYPASQIKANPHNNYKTNTFEEINPEYFPYCYPLGRKVCIYITSQGYNDAKNNKCLEWTVTEARDFISRMQHDSYIDELKSAGISCENMMDGLPYTKSHDHYGNIVYKDELVGSGDLTSQKVYFLYPGGKIDEFDGNTNGNNVAYYENNLLFFVDYKDAKELFNAEFYADLTYRVSMTDGGWQNWIDAGQTAGIPKKLPKMEALQIKRADKDGNSMLEYRAFVEGDGWTNWVDSSTDAYAGTVGQSKAITAVEIKLKEKYAEDYDVVYRSCNNLIGWSFWKANGDTAGKTDYTREPAEAIEINIVEKGKAAEYTGKTLSYRSNINGNGWGVWAENGESSGTSNKGKQMEALQINLSDIDGSSMLEYRAYVEGDGWQDWVDSSTDAYAGTIDQNKRIEALEIKLNGECAEQYIISYKVSIQGKGWGSWIKNGQTAGTPDSGNLIQAIQIKLEGK